jgi:hypothetical protein
MKLTYLYLLDSICKNVGKEYIKEFSTNIVTTFTEAYKSVKDEKMKLSFEKLLKTWPNIFPTDKLRVIEKGLSQSKEEIKDFQKIHVNPFYFQKQNTERNGSDLDLEKLKNLLEKELEKGNLYENNNVIQELVKKIIDILSQRTDNESKLFSEKLIQLIKPKTSNIIIPVNTIQIEKKKYVDSDITDTYYELYKSFQHICSTCGRRFRDKIVLGSYFY